MDPKQERTGRWPQIGMSESRQLTFATVLFLPFLIAAMVGITMAANTWSSELLLAAGLCASLLGHNWSLLGVMLYFAAALGLFRLMVRVSRRRGNRVGWLSAGLLVAALSATTWWFIVSWDYGVRFQGYHTTLMLARLNVASALGLLGGFAYALRHPSFRASVMIHGCLVAWLMGWALPYLGEYP